MSQQREMREVIAIVCKQVDSTLLKPERPPVKIHFYNIMRERSTAKRRWSSDLLLTVE
jgi:hypothetical protein